MQRNRFNQKFEFLNAFLKNGKLYCKELYHTILEFLEESDESNLCFEKLCENTKIIEGNRNEMTQFLLMIKTISDKHHRDGNFIKKVKDMLESPIQCSCLFHSS